MIKELKRKCIKCGKKVLLSMGMHYCITCKKYSCFDCVGDSSKCPNCHNYL